MSFQQISIILVTYKKNQLMILYQEYTTKFLVSSSSACNESVKMGTNRTRVGFYLKATTSHEFFGPIVATLVS